MPLTPRHRFRVASHSKSFTAAGIMKLREQGGSASTIRSGATSRGCIRRSPRRRSPSFSRIAPASCATASDSGQWLDRRSFLDERELRAALAAPPSIDANTRFKYSNLGFGLAGLVIEALTGEPYDRWIRHAIVEPAGLEETEPDMPFVKASLHGPWP